MNTIEIQPEEAEVIDRVFERLFAAYPGSVRTDKFTLICDGEGRRRGFVLRRNKELELSSAILDILAEHYPAARCWVDKNHNIRVQYSNNDKSKSLTLENARAYLEKLKNNPLEKA